MKKILAGVIVVAVMGTAYIWTVAFGTRNAEEVIGNNVMVQTLADAKYVELGEIERGSISESVEYSGKLAAEKEIAVLNKIPGIVTEVLVEIGDYVSEGDVLFKIEDEEIVDGIVAKKNQIVLSGVDLQLLEMTIEENMVNCNRMEKLFENEAISEVELTAARLQYEKTSSQIQQNKIKIKMMEAELEDLYDMMDDTTVRSPIEGHVNSRNVKEMEMAGGNTMAFSIIQTDMVMVDVSVSQNDIVRVKNGGEINVATNAVPGESFSGKIEYLSPSSNELTMKYDVRVAVENRDKLLQPGMLCKTSFSISESHDALLVPDESVLYDGEKRYMFILGEDGLASLVEVETGIEDANRIEIINGLAGDELIIVSGQEYLEDDSLIKIVEK